MGRSIIKCCKCKQDFRVEELVKYASASAKVMKWYCPKCLQAKQERERFADMVCRIFGIETPGPRIWTERKRLINEYGYTDNTIIDCLDYIYNVKRFKVFSESLCVIKPSLVEEMLKWKRSEEYKANSIVYAMTHTNVETFLTPEKITNNDNKQHWNIEDFLNDE